MGEFADFLRNVIEAFEESKIKYVIVGGVIAIHYGRFRLTQDIDIIALLTSENLKTINALVNSLRRRGFQIEKEEMINALNSHTHIMIFHKDYPVLHSDLKGVYNDLDRMVIENRVRNHIYCCEAWIEKLEDLIIAKLVYGSQQDIEDVIAILYAQREKININELTSKARRFNVNSILKDILKNIYYK